MPSRDAGDHDGECEWAEATSQAKAGRSASMITVISRRHRRRGYDPGA